MPKRLMVIVSLFAGIAFAGFGPVPVPGERAVSQLYTHPSSDSRGEGASQTVSDLPAAPATAGEQAGTTTYDIQENGAMGNRAMIDGDGNAHVCWMFSADQSTGNFADRAIHYNFFDAAAGEFVFASPVKASGVPRAGYTTMGLMSDGSAVIAFHHDPDGDGTHQSAVVVDAGAGLGAFSSPVNIDPATTAPPIWPHVAVGSDGAIHVVARPHIGNDATNPPSNYYNLYYSGSDDGGGSFSTWQSIFDDNCTDAAIAVSKDGKKVGIVTVGGVSVTDKEYPTVMGNVYVIESTNGGSTWSAPRKITDGRYADEIEIDPNVLWLFANADDLDCAYDNGGNLHVLFEEGFWNEQDYTDAPGGHASFFYFAFRGRVMHWSSATDEIVRVSGPYPNILFDDEEIDSLAFWGYPGDPAKDSECGACFPQLAVWDDDIVATWSGQWDTTDLSGAGTINNDIYGAISHDGGTTWEPLAGAEPEDIGTVWEHVTNITNTHAPGAGVGATPDESYHTVYPWVGEDSVLHITYIEDLFSGSCMSDGGAGGIYTINPVRYMTYGLAGIEEEPVTIAPILLSCPAIGKPPFNISFSNSLSAPGIFKVRNVAGQTVCEQKVSNGADGCYWSGLDDAGQKLPAGVYFMELESGFNKAGVKVTLLR